MNELEQERRLGEQGAAPRVRAPSAEGGYTRPLRLGGFKLQRSVLAGSELVFRKPLFVLTTRQNETKPFAINT